MNMKKDSEVLPTLSDSHTGIWRIENLPITPCTSKRGLSLDASSTDLFHGLISRDLKLI